MLKSISRISESRPPKMVRQIGFISLFSGIVVLVGWILQIKGLESIIPGFVTMKPNAAICFALLGVAMVIRNKVIYRFLLMLVSLIGLVTLLEYQFHFDLGIDQFIVKDYKLVTNRFPFPGRMAYNTTISFVLLGLGLLGLSAKLGRCQVVFQYFLHLVTVISGIAIIGYIYGVSMFYNFSYVSSMAIHAAILLLLLSIAAARLNPGLGVARLFTGSAVGNQMARRHFTTLMLALIVFGSLRIQSERFHILPPEVGISLLAVSLLLTSLVMIWMTANWLNKVDDQRSKAEEEIRNINLNLEVKVGKTEEKYHSLFEQASDAIYVLNASGDFVDVNDSACQLTGYSQQELVKMNIADLLSAKLLQNNPLVYTEVKPGKSIIAERKIIRKDGTIVDVEVNLKRFVDERILVIARDITQRKQMEAELKLSEQKYRLLFESNPLPLWIVAKDDMKVIVANHAAAKLYGYAPDELLHMDIKQLRPVAHWEGLIAAYAIEMTVATDFGVVEHLRKDGTSIFVDIIAQDIMFEGRFVRLSSTNDVTEKLKAEASLKKSEANLHTILDNTDTAYALLNAELDVVEYNNKALIFAQNEFNFEGKDATKVLELMSEDRRLEFMTYIKQVFEGHTISYEVSYPQTDNSQLWYYIRMFPISDKGQQILGLVLAISDITERKIAEQNLQTAYQSIQSHIEKIGEMGWKQSHLIRNPLANLKGLFPMIKADPTNGTLLGYVETELERMDKILWEMAEGSAMTEFSSAQTDNQKTE